MMEPQHRKQNGLSNYPIEFTLSCVRLRRAFLFGASLLNLCPGYPQCKRCKHAENLMAQKKITKLLSQAYSLKKGHNQTRFLKKKKKKILLSASFMFQNATLKSQDHNIQISSSPPI